MSPAQKSTPAAQRRFLACAVLAGLASATIGLEGGAAAEYVPPQSASLTFGTQHAGQRTPVSLAIDYFDPADSTAKPPAVKTVVLELASGTKIDDSVPERCTAPDAQLLLLGSSACPPASRVGGGELDVDTGVPGPARLLQRNAALFNNDDQMIMLLETKNGPPSRLVVRLRVEGTRITSEVPPTPGGPPDGFAAVKRVRLTLDARSSGGGDSARNYVTTPDSCPSGGWTNTMTFTYRDGRSFSASSRSPCVPGGAGTGADAADDAPPRVVLRGTPRRRCASDTFTARVRIAESGSGLRAAELWLDRRRLATTRRHSFERAISVSQLPAGTHRLRAVALDNSGNRGSARARFRRCAKSGR